MKKELEKFAIGSKTSLPAVGGHRPPAVVSANFVCTIDQGEKSFGPNLSSF